MKSEIFHLIVLDESGSMCPLKRNTINGCNETLNTIRSAQEKYAETQTHYVSIYAFQSDDRIPSRYLVKNKPISDVSNINEENYQPWGGTPLYDAVGSTLVDLKTVTSAKDFAVANVTIITDGEENASSHYSLEKVARMISSLKEIGWSFNFIGANICAKKVARGFNIDNALQFEADENGTDQMFRRERESRMQWLDRNEHVFRRIANTLECDEDDADFKAKIEAELRNNAQGYFDSSSDDDPVTD